MSTDRPSPPPGLVPPAYPSPSTQLEPPLPPAPPVPPVPAGYTRSHGLSLSPTALAWVPAVGLTLILFLTFFNWVGMYVGGHPVVSQNPWRMVSGNPTRNHRLEELVKKQEGWPLDQILNKVHWDKLTPPYLLMLLVGFVLAWAERMVATLDRNRLPPALRWVATVWPYRLPVLAALATVAFLLLAIQMVSGFNLEGAVKEVVSERFAEERKQAAGNPSALEKVEFKEGQELARYNLERTSWLWLALLLNLLVVVAMLARSGLERRGNRPPPRIVIQY
jgi:hypothetical protein